METTTLGLLPSGYPVCSRSCRCAGALNFLLLWLGWLLPAYLAARRQSWMLGNWEMRLAGNTPAPSQPEPGSADSARQLVATRSQSRSDRLAARLLSTVFLRDGMAGMEPTAWLVLTGLCWLGGTAAAQAAW